jgi:hypothetical protein
MPMDLSEKEERDRAECGIATDRPVAHIVLDTDVVSLHRSGRLPAGFARLVATNDLCIDLRGDAEAFEVRLDLEAREGDQPGWTRSWPRRIPRHVG